jgi:ketosteroid isomerase-like protein
MQTDELETRDIRCRIAEMLQSRMSRNIDQMLRHFAPDAVVHCASSREGVLPTGVWEGADALRSITRLNDENYEPLDHEILDILVDGKHAVVRWRGNWRRHANGKVYTIDAAHFLTWRNGLVVEMHEFFERASQFNPQTRYLSYSELLAERRPGLTREEMKKRSLELVNFPVNGPDVALIQKYCAPEIVCDFVGDRSRIPYAGRHVGVAALKNIVMAVAVDFEQSYFDVSDVLIEDGRVAGRRRVAWRHRGTGRRGVVDLANFVRFEDGLMVELIEFRDSVTLIEMRGDREN